MSSKYALSVTALILLLAGVLSACGIISGKASAPEMAVPTPTEIPTPVPEPTRSSQKVLITWGNPENLDSKHLNVTSRCTECHPPPYFAEFGKAACPACHDTSPREAPSNEVCLECHGGSTSGLADLTGDYQPINPHDYHYGADIRCSFCHKMHEPVTSPCGICHEDKKLTRISKDE